MHPNLVGPYGDCHKNFHRMMLYTWLALCTLQLESITKTAMCTMMIIPIPIPNPNSNPTKY